MKTIVEIPEETLERLDTLGRRLGLSRSDICSQAVAEFIAGHDADSVTAAMNQAIADCGHPEDTLSTAAARIVLGRNH